MRALAFALLFAAPVALAAPVPKELKKNDRARIVGTWLLTGESHGGKTLPADGSSWKLDADGSAAILRPGAGTAGGIKFAIDPGSEHKKFDWILIWGTWYGVYELRGETLTIYLSDVKGRSGDDSGRNLKPKPGPGISVYSFTRATTSE